MSTRTDVGLLFRRAGFGASATELDAAAAVGYDESVEQLLAGLTEADRAHPRLPALATFTENRLGHGGNSWDQYINLTGWWLDKMAVTTTPLREKLTLLLHGQFPTGFSKVGIPGLPA